MEYKTYFKIKVIAEPGFFDSTLFLCVLSALTLNKVSRLYLIPSLMRNMLDYYRSSPDKDQLLVDLKHWESTGEPLTLETAIAFFETFKGEDRTLANIYGGTEMMDNIYCYWTSIEEFKGSLSHENRVSSIDKNRGD